MMRFKWLLLRFDVGAIGKHRSLVQRMYSSSANITGGSRSAAAQWDAYWFRTTRTRSKLTFSL